MTEVQSRCVISVVCSGGHGMQPVVTGWTGRGLAASSISRQSLVIENMYVVAFKEVTGGKSPCWTRRWTWRIWMRDREEFDVCSPSDTRCGTIVAVDASLGAQILNFNIDVQSGSRKLVHFEIISTISRSIFFFSKTCQPAANLQTPQSHVLIHTYQTRKSPECLLLTILIFQHVLSRRKWRVVNQLSRAFFELTITKHSTFATGHEFASERPQNTKTGSLLELLKLMTIRHIAISSICQASKFHATLYIVAWKKSIFIHAFIVKSLF